MEITPLHHDELELLTRLQPKDWPDIRPSFEFYTSSAFCFPIKITIDTEIVGIGATIVHQDVAWLGHIIAHPNHRGKGIGKLITQTLVNISRQHKCETIYLIATDMGAPVYQKEGFVTETDYLFFKDILIREPLKPSACIETYREELKEQVTAMDKLNSGEDRIPHLEPHLEQGYQYTKEGTVEGFYLPTFGEGLIIANTEAAGLALLKLHLSFKDKVAFPKENLAARQFLYANGYKESHSAKRMVLGTSRSAKLANIYNRIGGNIG